MVNLNKCHNVKWACLRSIWMELDYFSENFKLHGSRKGSASLLILHTIACRAGAPVEPGRKPNRAKNRARRKIRRQGEGERRERNLSYYHAVPFSPLPLPPNTSPRSTPREVQPPPKLHQNARSAGYHTMTSVCIFSVQFFKIFLSAEEGDLVINVWNSKEKLGASRRVKQAANKPWPVSYGAMGRNSEICLQLVLQGNY